jgi:hypothetical protein
VERTDGEEEDEVQYVDFCSFLFASNWAVESWSLHFVPCPRNDGVWMHNTTSSPSRTRSVFPNITPIPVNTLSVLSPPDAISQFSALLLVSQGSTMPRQRRPLGRRDRGCPASPMYRKRAAV